MYLTFSITAVNQLALTDNPRLILRIFRFSDRVKKQKTAVDKVLR